MANLLAIEAAADGCSIALQVDDNCFHRFEQAPRMHSRVLYPMLDEVFSEAGIKPLELDAVVFSKGPGSFTGLRIAAATAQGIGYAANLPLIGVSTLQSMAQKCWQTHQSERIACVLDARMNELYFGCYQLEKSSNLMQPLCDDFISPVDVPNIPSAFDKERFSGCGNGWSLKENMPSELQLDPSHVYVDVVPEARFLLPMANALWSQGLTIQPQDVELVYLREQSHWKTVKEQKKQK